MVFFTHSLLRPFQGQVMIVGISLDPLVVLAGPLTEPFFAHSRHAQNLADKIHHLLGPGQPTEVAVYDDAVETFVNKSQQLVEQLPELFHGSALYSRGRTAWVGEASSVDQGSDGWRAKAFASPMKFVTFRTRPPTMTVGLSASV